MFNQLGSIVDRNFIIGFYIPALVFNLLSLILNKLISVNLGVFTSQEIDLSKATVFAAATLVVALILQGFTAQIYRFLEGYWPWDLQYRLAGPQRAKFSRLGRQKKKLEAEWQICDAQKVPFSPAKMRKLTHILRELTRNFPEEKESILPTSFGNTLRSFENYSLQQYGFEATEGWPRLCAVISSSFLDQINGAQAFCDFWVNTVVVAVLLAIESMLLLHQWMRLVIPAIFLITAVLSFQKARFAAEIWGQWVKSAFDIYLLDLASKLGFQPPQNIDDMRKLWNSYSEIIIYKTADDWQKLDRFRAGSKTPPPPAAGSG
jgi:hypothetical protein